MSELVERFIIPLNSIGYELRPSATMRGMARTVKKQTNKVMGWDIDTLKKEIAVMTEKLSQKEKKAAAFTRTDNANFQDCDCIPCSKTFLQISHWY